MSPSPMLGRSLLYVQSHCVAVSCTSLIYSGPLSTLIESGRPRQAMIWSSERMTRVVGSEKTTSMPRPSRLKSSSTLNRRKAQVSSRRSDIKSIDQLTLGDSGTASASGTSRFKRFLGLMHRLSSNSEVKSGRLARGSMDDISRCADTKSTGPSAKCDGPS
jgi:hypothetical protein